MKSALLKTVLLLLVIVIMACKRRESNSQGVYGIDTMLLKKVVFPESIVLLRSGLIYPIDSFLIKTEGQVKIVTIVDANCQSCIANQVELIEEKIFSVIPGDRVLMVFIMNIKSEEFSFFLSNLYPHIKSSGFILWDKDYSFERINNLFTAQLNLRTFMLSSANEIVLVGNPLICPEVIKDYGEYFQQY